MRDVAGGWRARSKGGAGRADPDPWRVVTEWIWRFGPGAAVLLAFARADRPPLPAGPWPWPEVYWILFGAVGAAVAYWPTAHAAPGTAAVAAVAAGSAGLVLLHAANAGTMVLVVAGAATVLRRVPQSRALAAALLCLAPGLAETVRVAPSGAVALVGLRSAATLYGALYAAVFALRQRRLRLDETERLLRELEREHRDLEAAHARLAEQARHAAEFAASEERNRIAAEIHDVLAHALTAIIIQAEAAAVRLRGDPGAARSQVETVADLARSALQEARLSVAAVRADPGMGGLDALRRLCAEAQRLTGMRCELRTAGAEYALPAPVAVAAYRILQEALTNARRHGQAALVRVDLVFGAGEIALTVEDDGSGSPPAGQEAVAGSGLRGMAERARALDGTVEAGERPEGRGFLVRARLPVASGAAARRAPTPTADDGPAPGAAQEGAP